MVWAAVYDGRSSVDGLSLDTLIVYLTLVNLQMFLMTTPIAQHIHSRIRTGVVFFDFMRPIGYPGSGTWLRGEPDPRVCHRGPARPAPRDGGVLDH